MATKLDKTIKRELDMEGHPYTVAISPEGVKLTQKGFRKGRVMSWKFFWEHGTDEATNGAHADSGTPQSPASK